MPFIRMQRGIVYGPLKSKRLGRSLGLNLHPSNRKICSFDCIYCHYGRTNVLKNLADRAEMPSVEEICKEVEVALASPIEMDYITFSGNGEPTIHPDFPEIVRNVIALRDKYREGVPIALLTNSTRAVDGEILEAISYLDFPMFKLDAGDRETFVKVNRPADVKALDAIISALATVKEVTIQSLFIDGDVRNIAPTQIESWLEALERIRPKRIQIVSIDWDIPEVGISRIPRDKLEDIACLVRERLPQVSVETFED